MDRHVRRPARGRPLLEVPVNCESYNLAYVPEHLDRLGLEVPATWDAYFDGAARLADGGVRGFGQRGLQVWHTMYTGYATQVLVGAAGATSTSTGAARSPSRRGRGGDREVHRGTTAWRGPPDWLEQRWYELALDFARGAYGLIVDSDHYVAFFEDEQYSSLVGRIGYAPPPPAPTFART